ncbi:hypothetical protein EW145_g4973 [Phellinidium pouzarii]|uniref:Uncharacterized protein n=1 Tax=Phellinidium pouzarii TaxID=167371 RepID=A0A4S4L274_9AGAM|nr:hypothetical protein EW145_g4973 [Phellinidium pouzarii]
MRGVYNRIAPSVPAVDPHAPEQMAVRRLLALQGYVLPVSFDVPPPAQLEGLMDKASGLSVRIQAWRVRQTETKAAHKRHLLAISEGRATSLPPRQSSSSSQNVFKQVFDWGVDQKRWKDEKKAQFNAHIGREDRRLREDVEVADRKEWNATKNLLWIVVVNAEQDTLIEGTEIVDSAADEEQIPDDEWRAEILAENEADSYMLNL